MGLGILGQPRSSLSSAKKGKSLYWRVRKYTQSDQNVTKLQAKDGCSLCTDSRWETKRCKSPARLLWLFNPLSHC